MGATCKCITCTCTCTCKHLGGTVGVCGSDLDSTCCPCLVLVVGERELRTWTWVVNGEGLRLGG